jgi:uncharacterized protein (DUF3820 family)
LDSGPTFGWADPNEDKMPEEVQLDTESLIELAKMKMPFGKYKDRLLIDLPEPYVVWFSQQGFPKGKLGKMLRAVYEIKLNGLEYLFKELR